MRFDRIDQKPWGFLLLIALLGLAAWFTELDPAAADPGLDRPAWSNGDNGLRPKRPSLRLHARASDILTPSQWVAQARP